MRRTGSVVVLVAVLLAGCAGSGGASRSPTATEAIPTPTGSVAPSASAEPTELDYVYFGDSVMWGLAERYADEIEAAVGAEVDLVNRTTGGGLARGLLLGLTPSGGVSQRNQEVLATAELITIEIPMGEYRLECGMGETTVEGTRTCMTAAREAIVEAADGIIARVVELRGPDEAMIRVILDHLFFYEIHRDQGTADEALRQWGAMNDEIAAIADRHGIRVVSLWDALMGPGAETVPMDAGLVADGVHLTPAGIDLAVEALLASGLDDLPLPGD
jgi:hypothetical protein